MAHRKLHSKVNIYIVQLGIVIFMPSFRLLWQGVPVVSGRSDQIAQAAVA
jgi:hypothetical protein